MSINFDQLAVMPLHLSGGLTLNMKAFDLFLGLQLFFMLTTYYGLGPFVGILWLLAGGRLSPMTTETRRLLWLSLPTIFLFLNQPLCVPILILSLLKMEKGVRVSGFERVIFAKLEAALSKIKTSATYTVTGVNSTNLDIQDVFEKYVSQLLEERMSVSLFPTVTARCVSTELVSYPLIDIQDRPSVNGVEADAYAARETLRMRVLIYSGLAIAGTYFMPQASTFLLCFSYLMYNLWSEVEARYLDLKAPKQVLKEGIYRLEKEWLGLVWSTATAVVYRGVMHTPYHFAQRCVVRYGRTMLKPFFASPELDVVTWGGMPQYASIGDADSIIMSLPGENNITSYKAYVNKSPDNFGFSWFGRTVPGMSGSPVFTEQEGVLKLVGLAGRWIRDEEARQVEYCVGVGYEHSSTVEEEKDGIIKINAHPGSGKTRRMIPAVIQSHLRKTRRPRIIVTGPTRVVCREIYDSLVHAFGDQNVGCNIKERPDLMRPGAMIQVGAHASIFNMIMSNDPKVHEPTMMIIDEAHVTDPTTELLTHIGYAMNKNYNGTLVLMSATLDNVCNRNSNHSIKETKVDASKIIDTIVDRVEDGKRVLVFVPGHTGAKGVVKTVEDLKARNIKALGLSRHTYTGVAKDLNNDDYRVVVSTNIAECGLNINNDVTVSTGEHFDYYTRGKVTAGEMRPITMASETQQRGRTGRTKPGEWIYVKKSEEREDPDLASRADANMILSGRSWMPDNYVNEHGVYLTNAQVQVWRKEGIPPRLVLLRYGPNGVLRTGQSLNTAIDDWLDGDVWFEGCSDSSCVCRGKCKWFDMREHDELVRLKKMRCADQPRTWVGYPLW